MPRSGSSYLHVANELQLKKKKKYSNLEIDP